MSTQDLTTSTGFTPVLAKLAEQLVGLLLGHNRQVMAMAEKESAQLKAENSMLKSKLENGM